MAKLKRTPSNIKKKLYEKRGNISAVARYFGVERKTIYKAINDNDDLKGALEDARETSIDDAESKLHELIDEGYYPAIAFYLKTQAKDRGYVERQELTGGDGSALEIKVTYDDD